MENAIEKSWIERNKEKLVLLFFILIKFALCAFPFEYGYFRDELYYIALSHHLGWGYIDVPPLLPFCIFLLRHTIGNSLFAIHLFSAMTGALVLIITWMIVKKMGGKLFSQILALTCMTFALCYIGISSMCNYDCINQIFWTLALYFLVALLVSENKKYWIYFGIAAGLGLMSKFDILWLGAGVAIALILTSQRKYLFTYQLWLGGVVALLIASPYFVWIAAHFSLVAEYYTKYHTATNPITFFELITEQTMILNPLSVFVWVAGLYYFLLSKTGKKFRLLGIAYFSILALCLVLHTKFYLSLPYYVVLFAGGAVCLESYFAGGSRRVLGSAYVVLIAVVGLFFVPYVRPLFPIPTFLKYAEIANHILPSFQTEKEIKTVTIPQHFADRFGWEDMAAEFGRICNSLPNEDRRNAVIVVRNYGEAGAVDFYRGSYNLPPVICGHLQYYLWMPKDLSEKTVSIQMGFPLDDLKKIFSDVKQVGTTHSKNAIYYENNQPIYVSKGFKIPPEKALQSLKNMHM